MADYKAMYLAAMDAMEQAVQLRRVILGGRGS